MCTEVCTDKGLNGAYIQLPLTFCHNCWELPRLKWVSCSLAAFERGVSWPALDPGRHFSDLCLMETAQTSL